MIDLHTHSAASDGSDTPSELMAHALEIGLHGIALTDHDTTAGLDEAIGYAQGRDIEVIPGIEFSTEYKLHMPTEQELINAVEEEKKNIELLKQEIITKNV